MIETNAILEAYEEFSKESTLSAAADIVNTTGIVDFLEKLCFYVDNPQETVAVSRALYILKSQESWLYTGIKEGTL